MAVKINIEDIRQRQQERDEFNRLELKDIEFYVNGKLVLISDEEIEKWEFVGLGNTCFAANREWPVTKKDADK